MNSSCMYASSIDKHKCIPSTRILEISRHTTRHELRIESGGIRFTNVMLTCRFINKSI